MAATDPPLYPLLILLAATIALLAAGRALWPRPLLRRTHAH